MPAAKPLPADYTERVYAGVLGKIIGVYLGRPFEGWTYDRIMKELGEVNYYVHEKLNKPLVVTDDDISGTFTFLRALEDFGYSKNLTAAQIGQTWLNYIIEHRTILWWGGMGTSTEHTAFMRLKRGITAPRSGSMELNGRAVAEQIGSQIFIDGWGMVSPGDPARAAELAKRAASVSHDGEAIYGAQVVAVLVAQAFVEARLDALLDTAVKYIPNKCTIRRLIDDIRGWHAKDSDWRKTRERIEAHYGYDKFGGGCHMIPNHALIVLGLVYGDDDFQKSLMIANTAGWDTDCNSGNVGAILGVKNGLACIDAGPDWRGPVADRIFLPTADGGRCLTDAVRETYEIVRAGSALVGTQAAAPKGGARYHFELPGAVQGFRFDDASECKCVGTVWNTKGHSRRGERSLALGFGRLAPGRVARAKAETFLSPESAKMPGYTLVACPALYPGQTIQAGIEAGEELTGEAEARLFIRVFGEKDVTKFMHGPAVKLAPGRAQELAWKIPDLDGQPVCEVGLEVVSALRADGTVYLDYLTWDGAPTVALGKPEAAGTFWQKAWVDAADRFWCGDAKWPYHIAQDEGPGMGIQGSREWSDYAVTVRVRPHLAVSAGVAACVQGLKRYYALVLTSGNKLQLVKEHYGRKVLAQKAFKWSFDEEFDLRLETRGGKLTAYVNGKKVLAAEDKREPFLSGAVGLLCEEGRADYGPVKVKAL